MAGGALAAWSVAYRAGVRNRLTRPLGTVLTFTETGAPATVTAGKTAGLQLAGTSTVTDQSGTADMAGNTWLPTTGGQGATFAALGSDMASDSTDTTAPTFTAGAAVARATTVVFTASEAVDVSTVDTTDVTRVGGTTTASSVAVSSDGLTITATRRHPWLPATR